MKNLSYFQLSKLSIDELDSLIDALYEDIDVLKQVVEKNPFSNDFGSVSTRYGVNSSLELNNIKSYIKRIESVLDEKASVN